MASERGFQKITVASACCFQNIGLFRMLYRSLLPKKKETYIASQNLKDLYMWLPRKQRAFQNSSVASAKHRGLSKPRWLPGKQRGCRHRGFCKTAERQVPPT